MQIRTETLLITPVADWRLRTLNVLLFLKLAADLHGPHPGGGQPVPGAVPLLRPRHGVPVPRPQDRGPRAPRVRAGRGRLQEPAGQRRQPEPRHLGRVRRGQDGDHQVHPGVSLQVRH